MDLKNEDGVELLLVSSQTRVLILGLNADNPIVVQIGSKLRQGNFGACFYSSDESAALKVFSTRPGKRIWIADPHSGQVLSTLKFLVPQDPVFFLPKAEGAPIERRHTHFFHVHLFTFRKSKSDEPQLIVWSPGTCNLYFIDPIKVQVSEWHVDFGQIHDIAFDGHDKLFLLHGSDRKVSVLSSCSDVMFMDALCQHSVHQKAQVALDYGISNAPLLNALRKQLSGDGNDELRQALSDTIDQAERHESDKVESLVDEDPNDKTSGPSFARQHVEISALDDDDPVFLALDEDETVYDHIPDGVENTTAEAVGLSGYFPLTTLSSYLPSLPRRRGKRHSSGPKGIQNIPTHPLNELTAPILQTAMSVDNTGENIEVEVLMEAISANIWETSVKFESKLPLSQQLDLPSPEPELVEPDLIPEPIAEEESVLAKENEEPVYTYEASPQTMVRQPIERKASRRSGPIPSLRRHRSVDPHTADISYAHVLQCSMIDRSDDLKAVFERQVDDLTSELSAAAIAAEKEPRFVNRIWPSSGITRTAACLTHLALHQENFTLLEKYLEDWLKCFNPSAGAENDELNGDTNGWSRGRALVSGDGLPLTRNDWQLVRSMVTTYFQLKTAFHTVSMQDCVVKPCVDGIVQWSADEAYDFTKAYQLYLVHDYAAESCSVREYSAALDVILDAALSNANIARRCDEIAREIAENHIQKALNELAAPHEETSYCLILHLLNLMFKKCESQATKLCVSRYPALKPWNVRRSLFGSGTSIELASSPVEALQRYFAYLSLLFIEKDVVRFDCVLIEQWIRIGLRLNIEKHPWIEYLTEPDHLNLWDTFAEDSCSRELIQLVCVGFQHNTVDRWSRLDYVVETFPDQVAADFITQEVVDLPEFEEICRRLLLSDTRMFRPVLEVLSVENVLRKLGPGHLTLEICHQLLSVRQVETKQVEVVKALMEQLDTAIWSEKSEPNVLCPQLRAVLQLERGQLESQEMKPTATVSPQTSKSSCRTFWEDRNCGWGTRLNLQDDVCINCQMVLNVIKDDDVVIFSCGHAVHQFCMSDRVCSRCLVETFSIV